MTIAVGFNPRNRQAIRGRVAERRLKEHSQASLNRRCATPRPLAYAPVASKPRLPSNGRSATTQKLRCARGDIFPLLLLKEENRRSYYREFGNSFAAESRAGFFRDCARSKLASPQFTDGNEENKDFVSS